MVYDPYATEGFEHNPYAAMREGQSLANIKPAEFKHGGLGIASFILSLISGVMLLILVVIAGVMESSSPDGLDEESNEAIVLSLSLIGFLFGSFVAALLGFIGLFQSRRKKLFAIMGMLFGGLTCFGVFGLMLIGLAIE